MGIVIGWDIGGVHLKAARAEDGRITKAAQYASPLRDGTGRLLQAFAEARAEMGRADRNVVTMTGELADTFASRKEGVACLVELAAPRARRHFGLRRPGGLRPPGGGRAP